MSGASQKILAIDTAAPRLQLALLVGDETDVEIVDIGKGHAEILFARIDVLLQRNRIAYTDLTRIAVTSGPGSFTGLRIGLAAARGLGLALGIPVVGVPSLLALSLRAEPGRPAAVLVDARRDEAYFQTFFGPGDPIDTPELLPIAVARQHVQYGVTPLEDPFVDIAAMARFAAGLDPELFPPEATYVRDADAKPQDKARLARTRVPAS